MRRTLFRLLEPWQLARVVAVSTVGERWRRVRLSSAIPPRSAPTVELRLAGHTRRFTPAWLDRTRGEFEFVQFMHGGEGPGTRWLSAVREGDSVPLRWLEQGLELGAGSEPHVFCGDESCVGLAERLSRRAASRELEVALESSVPPPLSSAAWLVRTGARAEAQWRWLARQSRRATFYLAGHGPSVRRLAARLRSSGVARVRIHTAIHWADGRVGL